MKRKILFPLILINLKTYKQGTGQKALSLGKICEKISRNTQVTIALAVQATDIRLLTTNLHIPIFAQHIDPIKPGSNTGQVLLEAIMEAGACGTLINHSERKIQLAEIAKIIERTKEHNILSCVCASTPKIAGAVAALEPDMCATEPPELIGSGIPVSKAQPEILTDTVEIIQKINSNVVPLCGAGITEASDVQRALELGTRGILIASGIVKAEKPEMIIKEMVKVAEKFIS
ncbi:MAG: triose-phosphate isomerase [Asgard group archaeon]|nr:triose-phosphate isomerase [Asgard group archaeon]